jgi:hypothetical protein
MSAVTIKIGADPELFLRDIKTSKLVSAHDLLKGTKENPFKVNCGAVQVDGVAAEFNINPATSNLEFVTNIQVVMQQLQAMLPYHELQIYPVAVFDEAYFKMLPEETRKLGCNPDFNAWTGKQNPPPDGSITTMRTASGHIHIGWTEDADVDDPSHFDDCCEVAKQLDYYIGVMSLLWDNDNRRRELYGKAGAFRVKPYGMEYRTLSNRWLINNRLQSWIWNTAYYAVYNLMNGQCLSEKHGDLARKIIDTNNVDYVQHGPWKQEVWKYIDVTWPTW